jgi:hypothetical protein
MPAILSDLGRGGDVEWLAQYLARRRTMDMGLDDRPELDRRAAEAIIAWNSRVAADCCYRLLATESSAELGVSQRATSSDASAGQPPAGFTRKH